MVNRGIDIENPVAYACVGLLFGGLTLLGCSGSEDVGSSAGGSQEGSGSGGSSGSDGSTAGQPNEAETSTGGGSAEGGGGSPSSSSGDQGSSSEENPTSSESGDASSEPTGGSSEGGEQTWEMPAEPLPKLLSWGASMIEPTASAEAHGVESAAGALRVLPVWDGGVLPISWWGAPCNPGPVEVAIPGISPEDGWVISSPGGSLTAEIRPDGVIASVNPSGCSSLILEVYHPDLSFPDGHQGPPVSIKAPDSQIGGSLIWLPRVIREGPHTLRVRPSWPDPDDIGEGMPVSGDVSVFRGGELVSKTPAGAGCQGDTIDDGVIGACVNLEVGQQTLVFHGQRWAPDGAYAGDVSAHQTVVIPAFHVELGGAGSYGFGAPPRTIGFEALFVDLPLDIIGPGAADEEEWIVTGSIRGLDSRGEEVSAAGFSQITTLSEGVARVWVDPVWLHGVRSLTEARVTVRHPDRGRPVAEGTVSLFGADIPPTDRPSVTGPGTIMGPPPPWLPPGKLSGANGNADRHAVIFSHGWCAGGNGWPKDDFEFNPNVDKLFPVISDGPRSTTRGELAKLAYNHTLGYGTNYQCGHPLAGLG